MQTSISTMNNSAALLPANQNGMARTGNLLAPPEASMAKIDKVAGEFESQFIGQMLENMFSTVDTGEFLGGGEAEEMYRSMIIDEYGKLMSRSGGIGVADHIKREMLRMQEV